MYSNTDPHQYCVFPESGEPQQVKAETAYEAFKLSGLAHAVKIERISFTAKNIVEKSRFAEEAPQAAADGESIHDIIQRRRNPILSALEMDDMMRLLREAAEAEEKQKESHPEPAPVAVEAAPVVPPPQEEPAVAADAPIRGTDIHGDGFDEIIPANTPVTPPAPLKHAEHKDEVPPASAMPAEPVPQRELSAEEVEKLLGGK